MVSAKALVVPSKGAGFEPREVQLNPLQPNEVLVDLIATGVCHTDIKAAEGVFSTTFPAILGHEGAGVVREIGSEVTNVGPGDHVVLSYNYCGECRSCRDKCTYHCLITRRMNFGCQRTDGSQTAKLDGEDVTTCFFGQSSFCNPAIVQKASCIKVEKHLPLAVLCVLGCGFQTGAGSVINVVKPVERKIRSLAIFGIGGVGFAAILAARYLNTIHPESAFSVIAVDIIESRLKLAQEFGATHLINNNGQTTLRDDIQKLTNGEGLDAAIDCTGSIRVINEMIELLGPGGIAVTVGGPPPGAKASIECATILQRCAEYRGCQQGNSYAKEFIPWLAKLYTEGHFPLEKMQKTYNVKDINLACQDTESGAVIKPILLWK